jgi:6-phosphogluconolactonase
MSRKSIGLLIGGLFSLSAAQAWADGAVYAMTNALGNNEVHVYHRANNGTLSPLQTIATGGGGSGLQLAGIDSLGSAGSIQLDEKHHLLFVVNTESAKENNGAGAYNQDCKEGTITSFIVSSDGQLRFADRVFSGGLFPDSLTVKSVERDDHGHNRARLIEILRGLGGRSQPEDVLYVLNAGGPGTPTACNTTPHIAGKPNITGFTVDRLGRMTPVGSVQARPQRTFSAASTRRPFPARRHRSNSPPAAISWSCRSRVPTRSTSFRSATTAGQATRR